MLSWNEVEHARQVEKENYMVKLPLLSTAQCDDLFSNRISRMSIVIEYLKNNLEMV